MDGAVIAPRSTSRARHPPPMAGRPKPDFLLSGFKTAVRIESQRR
ncbi:hypothetical protein RHAL1_01049 [Beijerinckiaceae bacterium RH AL1]|nr:hypothetical protein RHCH11_RHCH11_01025 [Beijerinckiaceae bacterium RH CH11]VVB44100.1 hypothetical protein RHAL8_01022 [Beijerinckiaceae bacterium RH AL8]VVC54156.1 hypothetical protein RHAL1_01049 [Beijerinckiaceae bacterium RH AL1]